MSKNKIIISSSDNKYFFLIKELYLSLKNNGILDEYDFAILDTGLDLKQKNYFQDYKYYISSNPYSIDSIKNFIDGNQNFCDNLEGDELLIIVKNEQ